MSTMIQCMLCAAALLLAHPRMNERRRWAALSAALRLGLAALGALSVGVSFGQGHRAGGDWAAGALLLLASLSVSASALLRHSGALRMAVGGALGLLICAGAWLGALRPVLVHTPSVPLGLYATEPVREQPSVGQYVCLLASHPRGPEVQQRMLAQGLLPSEWKRVPLLKRVAASEGARIELEAAGAHSTGGRVRVDGQLLLRSAQLGPSRTRTGRALPQPSYPYTLSEGQLYLASAHPEGWDSRYFGPVHFEALSCVARPLWTWDVTGAGRS